VDNLVDGLVAAASVLGSAQLISRRTGPTLGSISLPGLVAAGVGVLTWQRLVRRRHEHKTWVSRAREMTERRRPTPT
jgi:ubiquinone biosynthesis protein